MKSSSNGGVLKCSLQMLHVQVLLVAPLRAGDMAQPSTDQHEGGVAIRETAYHTGSAAYLTVQPFHDIVGPDTSPVFTGKIAVGQRFLNAILHFFSGLYQLHGAQFLHHGLGFFPGCFLALLSMDRLEHFGYQFHLGARRNGKYISVEVDDSSLVLGFGKHFSHCLQHTKALVPNDEFYSIQTAAAQPLEKVDPAGFVLLHALGSTQNLTVASVIHCNSHQKGHIFKLSAPISA